MKICSSTQTVIQNSVIQAIRYWKINICRSKTRVFSLWHDDENMIWLVDNFAHIVGNSVSKGCGPMQWTTSEGSPWTKFSQSSYFAEIWSDSFLVAISGIFIEIWEMEIKHWIETLIFFGVFSTNWFQIRQKFSNLVCAFGLH